MSILSLDADELAPVRARRFVGELLVAAQLTDLSDEAQLLTSELVTNALVHTGSAVELSVTTTPDAVTVRVQDADTGPITGSTAHAEDSLIEGGRGLVLVHELAEAWGTEHHAGRKAVWFRLSLPNETAPDARSTEGNTPDQPATTHLEQTSRHAAQAL